MLATHRVPPAWRTLLLVTPIVALSLVLRWSRLDAGYTSDELCNFTGATLGNIIFVPESGVNPPLLRLIFNGLFDDVRAVDVGRWFSLLCVPPTIVWAFRMGTLCASGRALGGVIAALFLAADPWAILESTVFRSYSAWLMFMTWHLYAALRFDAAAPEERRRWGLQVAASAIVLPWIHYASMPILLCVGLTRWQRTRWYIPAAFTSVPLLWLIATYTGGRQPSGLTREVVEFSGTVMLGGQTYVRCMPWLLGAIEVARGFAPSPMRRVAYVGLGAVFGSVLLLSMGHSVRPTACIWALPFLAALLAGAGDLTRGLWLVIPVAGASVLMGTTDSRPIECRNEVRTMAKSFERYDAHRGHRPIFVSPGYQHGAFWVYENRTPIDTPGMTPAACRRWHDACVELRGVDVVPLADDADVPDGIVIHGDVNPLPRLHDACEVLRSEQCMHVYDCRGTPP